MSKPRSYTEAYTWVFENERTYNNHKPDEPSYMFACKNLGEASSLVDVGTGKGTFISALRDRKIDVRVSTIDVGHFHSFKDIDHHIMDMTSVNWDPPKADLVTCLGVLEHIYEEDLDQALENLSKVAPRAVFTIANHYWEPLKDGFEIHAICEGIPWWKNRLSRFFEIVSELETVVPHVYDPDLPKAGGSWGIVLTSKEFKVGS